jgi:hypothetical protein
MLVAGGGEDLEHGSRRLLGFRLRPPTRPAARPAGIPDPQQPLHGRPALAQGHPDIGAAPSDRRDRCPRHARSNTPRPRHRRRCVLAARTLRSSSQAKGKPVAFRLLSRGGWILAASPIPGGITAGSGCPRRQLVATATGSGCPAAGRDQRRAVSWGRPFPTQGSQARPRHNRHRSSGRPAAR